MVGFTQQIENGVSRVLVGLLTHEQHDKEKSCLPEGKDAEVPSCQEIS